MDHVKSQQNSTSLWFLNREIYKPKILLLVISPPTDTQSGTTENFNISTEYTTIPNSPSPFVIQADLDTKR